MKHIFIQGKDPIKPTLVLLHGTGGDEQSLLSLADLIDPEASILSIRGNVLENGMPRFFKRVAEGIFDLEDLEKRTFELKEFIDQAADQYEFDRKKCVAIGYSNGANIAASLLFYFETVLQGAILHHPMVPRRDILLPDLTGIPVFIGAGTNDPLCAPEETNELRDMLQTKGADVTVHWDHFGHQLTMKEVEKAAEWYHKFI